MDCREIFTSSYDPCDFKSTLSFYGVIFCFCLLTSIIYAIAIFISYKTLKSFWQKLIFIISNLILLIIFTIKNVNLTGVVYTPYLWLEIAAGFIILFIVFGQHIYNLYNLLKSPKS
jgi:drug/metabolite transporter (DMT)-like permease